jgi:hypothetical protein
VGRHSVYEDEVQREIKPHETRKACDAIAAEECAGLEAALRAVATENEPNPVTRKWGDMNNIRRMGE